MGKSRDCLENETQALPARIKTGDPFPILRCMKQAWERLPPDDLKQPINKKIVY